MREKEGGRGIYGRSTLDPKHAAPNLPHVAILIPVGIWSAEEVGLKRSRRPRCSRRNQRCRRQRSEWMRPGARGTPGRRTPESKHARYRAYSGSNPCWHRASSSRHSWMTNTRVKAAAPNLWYMHGGNPCWHWVRRRNQIEEKPVGDVQGAITAAVAAQRADAASSSGAPGHARPIQSMRGPTYLIPVGIRQPKKLD